MAPKNAGTHTPGPWTIENEDQINAWDPDTGCVDGPKCGACRVTVAKILTDFRVEANAALIAAAPDLLSALRLVASNEANMAGCDRVTQGAIRAAIAKVEGRDA